MIFIIIISVSSIKLIQYQVPKKYPIDELYLKKYIKIRLSLESKSYNLVRKGEIISNV